MTTIVEFRNSKQRITKHHNPDIFEDGDLQATSCWVYGQSDAGYEWGYIEIITVYTIVEDDLHPMPLNVLTLGNEQWVSDNLAELEEKLFEWQTDNGAFEPTPSEMRQRLLAISQEAMDAFWTVIASRYPECETGDLGPRATQDFEQSVYKVVTTWRDNNGGGQNVK